MRFEDRVVVVTGAASGFGEAIARRAAAEGAAVVIGDRDLPGGERIAASIEEAGGRAVAVEVDVSRSADVAGLFLKSVEVFGGVDVIVNNAGFSHRATPLVDLAEDEYDRVFATNTKGVYLGAVHGVPHLRARGGGVIVNTASIGAVRPRPNLTAYNATKAAVVVLTRGLATELGPEGIRVNAVCPLASETPFLQSALGIEKLAPAVREAMEKDVPLRRLTRPEDVAAAVLFLASDDAAFLTGVCLDVDGGKSIA
jgi:3-oxoacyl-[acyl-carrier protein] reductase